MVIQAEPRRKDVETRDVDAVSGPLSRTTHSGRQNCHRYRRNARSGIGREGIRCGHRRRALPAEVRDYAAGAGRRLGLSERIPHVLNLLARLTDETPPAPIAAPPALALKIAPEANVARYDALRWGRHVA